MQIDLYFFSRDIKNSKFSSIHFVINLIPTYFNSFIFQQNLGFFLSIIIRFLFQNKLTG